MSLRRGISRISEEWYRDLEGIGNRKSLALAEYEASLTEPPYRDICTSSNTMSSSVDRIIHCFLCHMFTWYILSDGKFVPNTDQDKDIDLICGQIHTLCQVCMVYFD